MRKRCCWFEVKNSINRLFVLLVHVDILSGHFSLPQRRLYAFYLRFYLLELFVLLIKCYSYDMTNFQFLWQRSKYIFFQSVSRQICLDTVLVKKYGTSTCTMVKIVRLCANSLVDCQCLCVLYWEPIWNITSLHNHLRRSAAMCYELSSIRHRVI